MKPTAPAVIEVTEFGPEQFALIVTIGGERFSCGNYLNRAAAQQAGRLFVQRKEGEAIGQRSRPKRKPEPRKKRSS